MSSAGASCGMQSSTLEEVKSCVDNKWKNYIDGMNRNISIYNIVYLASFAGFGVLWAGGILEAIINRPSLYLSSNIVPNIHYLPSLSKGDAWALSLSWKLSL